MMKPEPRLRASCIASVALPLVGVEVVEQLVERRAFRRIGERHAAAADHAGWCRY